MRKDEKELSIKEIFNLTHKFQSSGEIESAHEFEFYVVKKMSINLDIFFYGKTIEIIF